MASDREYTYDWKDTSSDGFFWQERINDKLRLVYLESHILEGKNTDGDIDTSAGFLVEVKWESNSAESKRVSIEVSQNIHYENSFQIKETIPTALSLTKSRYYAHCDTDGLVIWTKVDTLRKYIERYKDRLDRQLDIKLRQGDGRYTYFNNYLIYLNEFKGMQGLLSFSKYCYYDEINADFIKKWII